jgi:hypothetical protein
MSVIEDMTKEMQEVRDEHLLPRHGYISINRQFNSTMENNFAGIRACSLSYPGAGVR